MKKAKVSERRYAFTTKEIYSAVYKKLTEKGIEIAIPIFSYSGFIEMQTSANFAEFTEIFKEATGFEYTEQFSNDNESENKKNKS